MSAPATKHLRLLGALCCLVGAGFLVFADFGGTWDVQSTPTVSSRSCWDGADGTTTCTDRGVSRSDEYYFYEVGAGPLETLALLGTSGALVAAAAFALSRGGGGLRRAARLSGSAVVAVLVITAVFVAESVGSGDWWFDAGFYGGLSGGLVGAALLRLDQRSAAAAA